MSSEKTLVIDLLWDILHKEGRGRRMVMQSDVTKAIRLLRRTHNIELSTDNPANFMKDVVRGDNANSFWPARLTEKRVTARQRPGKKRVFEFIDFLPDQTDPFPNPYTARPGMKTLPVEAVSLSLAKRKLGRRDESWLVQVAVELHLIQMHLATKSRLEIDEISHLQTGVKLGKSEIDCLFLAQIRDGLGGHEQMLVTCEAKQEGQRILEHQIVEQIAASAKSVRQAGIDVTAIIPVALKAIPGGKIYVAEFELWPINEASKAEQDRGLIRLASEGLYELRPPVPGVGHKNLKTEAERKKLGRKSISQLKTRKL
jgi:hypothetical protein